MEVYRIIKWAERHEDAETRKRKGALTSIPVPTKMRLSLRKFLRTPSGLETFGAYIVLAEIAARMPIRGVLADANGPLKVDDISELSGADPERLGAALNALSMPPLQWIERVTWLPGAEPNHVESAETVGASTADSGRRVGVSPILRASSLSSSSLHSSSSQKPTTTSSGALAVLLKRAGVAAGRIKELAEKKPELTFEDALCHWHDVRHDKGVRSIAAVLTTRVFGDGVPNKRITLAIVEEALGARVITEAEADAARLPLQIAKVRAEHAEAKRLMSSREPALLAQLAQLESQQRSAVK